MTPTRRLIELQMPASQNTPTSTIISLLAPCAVRVFPLPLLWSACSNSGIFADRGAALPGRECLLRAGAQASLTSRLFHRPFLHRPFLPLHLDPVHAALTWPRVYTGYCSLKDVEASAETGPSQHPRWRTSTRSARRRGSRTRLKDGWHQSSSRKRTMATSTSWYSIWKMAR